MPNRKIDFNSKKNEENGEEQKEQPDKQNNKDDSTIFMNQIRFLEKQLSKYENVEPFDISTPQTYKKIDTESNKSTTTATRENIFIGEEDEKNQKSYKKKLVKEQPRLHTKSLINEHLK